MACSQPHEYRMHVLWSWSTVDSCLACLACYYCNKTYSLCSLFSADIIFCIYVYQRWIYRVDPKRINEFGTSGEMVDGPPAEDGGTVNGTVHAIEDAASVGTQAKVKNVTASSPGCIKSKAAKKED